MKLNSIAAISKAHTVFFVIFIILILTIGKNLLPITDQMFSFHDETLPSRVAEFSFNLRHLQIPPRIVPHYSFNMGLPIFNFYAPFSYWVTSALNLLGLDVADSIKSSFLLALVTAFTGMYLLLKQKFTKSSSLLGAALYASSPYFAVEIFIRGNIAEAWFLGLFPVVLFLIQRNSQSNSKYIFVSAVVLISCILTTHNIFSLLMIGILPIYIFIHEKIRKNIFAFILAIALSSYFLIPALFELHLTHAAILVGSNYADHFLCLKQLWSMPQWDYGLSLPGCNDSLPFLLGKLQIMMGISGLISAVFIILLKHTQLKQKLLTLFYVLVLTFSIFLTTYSSSFVWILFKPILSLFQFPWRFLVFGVFGLAYFSGFITDIIDRKIKYFSFLFIIIAAFSLSYNSKFFVKVTESKAEYSKDFLSDIFVQKRVGYKIPEYLPATVNYKVWLLYEPQVDGTEKKDSHMLNKSFIIPLEKGTVMETKNEVFIKEAKTDLNKFKVNIHYFPFWKIYINGEQIEPKIFDSLGRPVLTAGGGMKLVTLKYRQTTIEVLGNLLTIVTVTFLIFVLVRKKNGL